MDTKRWWESKTVLASLVVVLATIASMAGVQVDLTDQAEIVDLVYAIITSVAGLIAIYGRIKATATITKKSGE